MIPKVVYSGTLYVVKTFLLRFGVEFTSVDGSDPSSYRDAVKPNTKVCLKNKISNYLLPH